MKIDRTESNRKEFHHFFSKLVKHTMIVFSNFCIIPKKLVPEKLNVDVIKIKIYEHYNYFHLILP